VLLERTERHDSARCIARAIALLREGGVAQLHAALRHLPVRELAAQVYVQAEDVRNAVDSVQALLRVVDTDRPASIAELLRVIRTQEERRESAAAQGASGLVLSTIEQAKGLEYDHVVIPGLGRGEFDGDDADERNLFYVAVSRGRDTVELVHGRGPVSRFVPAG
jgi:DNA helicase-2/ATP-dependent DNA helicase PcrA